MARAKSKQTIVEQQHAKLLKKRGEKLTDWEDKIFKQAIGDIAAKEDEIFEDVLDIYREKEVNAEFEAFLENKDSNEPKEESKKEKSTDSDLVDSKTNELKY